MTKAKSFGKKSLLESEMDYLYQNAQHDAITGELDFDKVLLEFARAITCYNVTNVSEHIDKILDYSN